MNILDQEHDEEQQGGKPPAEEEDMRPDAPESEEDESEEAVEWDGSEAELVLDDDAADYEEPQTGVKLSYTLREEEVFHALGKSGFSKTLGRRAVAEGVVLALLAAWFFFQYAQSGEGAVLFFGCIAVLALAAVALVPYLSRKKRAKEICRNERIAHVEMEIYPDGIQIGRGEGEWEIPFDGSCRREKHRGLMLFFPAGKKHMLILPLRCIEPNVLPEIQAMILAGTTSHEEE